MLQHIDALIAFSGIILLASLLVTVITQMVVAVVNLRGKNLLWGMTRLLKQIEPDLEEEAEKVVRKLLQNPLICRTRKRLPAVIRMEEFSSLLIRMAESENLDEFSEKTQKALQDLTRTDPSRLAKQLEKLPDNIEEKARQNLRKAQQAVYNNLKQARVKILELEDWFDNITDRMSERFTLHSRLLTVAGAVLIAIVLQLDAIKLLKQVYSDSALRSRLVASSDLFLQRGEEILGQRNVFDLAMDSLRSHIELPLPSKSFANRISAENWLTENLPANQNLDSALIRYRDFQRQITGDRLNYLGDQVLALNQQLSDLNLPIFGADYHWKFWCWKYTKFLGILISIGLLSLGAPFWFNALKNLSNLRTRIMKNEEQERQARKKQQE